MPSSDPKPINAPGLSNLCDAFVSRPVRVRQLQNRKHFGVVVILTRNGINGFDFIGTQNEAISRY
jgi:hypothetical protein